MLDTTINRRDPINAIIICGNITDNKSVVGSTFTLFDDGEHFNNINSTPYADIDKSTFFKATPNQILLINQYKI